MRKPILALGFASVVIAATPLAVSAQTVGQFYGEAGYSKLNVDIDIPGAPKFKPDALRLSIGYVPAPNLAVEGLFATGLSGSSKNIDGVNVKVDLKESFGIYLRPFVDLNDTVQLYARLGFISAKAKASASAPGITVSATDRDEDFSYGIGAAFNVSKTVALTVDYTQFFDKDGVDVSGYGVGLRFNF
jgi:opacity protein-like surface antigen